MTDSYNYGDTPSYPLTCGADSAGATGSSYNGWIDELRITKGVARYTGNFTPPQDGLPVPGTYSVSGVVYDDTGAVAIRTVRLYDRETGELLSTTTTAADGSYAFSLNSAGEVQVIAMDDTAGTLYNDLIHRALPG